MSLNYYRNRCFFFTLEKIISTQKKIKEIKNKEKFIKFTKKKLEKYLSTKNEIKNISHEKDYLRKKLENKIESDLQKNKKSREENLHKRNLIIEAKKKIEDLLKNLNSLYLVDQAPINYYNIVSSIRESYKI